MKKYLLRCNQYAQIVTASKNVPTLCTNTRECSIKGVPYCLVYGKAVDFILWNDDVMCIARHYLVHTSYQAGVFCMHKGEPCRRRAEYGRVSLRYYCGSADKLLVLMVVGKEWCLPKKSINNWKLSSKFMASDLYPPENRRKNVSSNFCIYVIFYLFRPKWTPYHFIKKKNLNLNFTACPL